MLDLPISIYFRKPYYAPFFVQLCNCTKRITFYSMYRGPPICPSGRMDYVEIDQRRPKNFIGSLHIIP